MALQGANRIVPQKEMLLNVDNSVILAFCWPACGGTVAKNGPFAQRPYNGFINAVTGSILEFLAFLGLHLGCFWQPPRSNS